MLVEHGAQQHAGPAGPPRHPKRRRSARGAGPEPVGRNRSSGRPQPGSGSPPGPARAVRSGTAQLSPPVEHHPAPAVRAAVGQRRFQLPIDTARNGTVTMTAMRLTRLPAWRPRLQHRVPLGERGRLPLPPPAQLLNEHLKLPQPLVLLSHLHVPSANSRSRPRTRRSSERSPLQAPPESTPPRPRSNPPRAERGGPSRTARSTPLSSYDRTVAVAISASTIVPSRTRRARRLAGWLSPEAGC